MRKLTDERIERLDLDSMRDFLSLGHASPADGDRFCELWNASGKHFYECHRSGNSLSLFDPPVTAARTGHGA